MHWVWVLALTACATGTWDAADSGASNPDAAPVVVDGAPSPPDAQGTPDATPVPDAIPLPDAVPLSTCEAADLMPENDACADAIDLNEFMGPSGVIIHGDTNSYTDTLEPPTSCTSGWGEDGPEAIYRVNASVGQKITAMVAPEGYDASVYILVGCSPDACVAGLDTGGDDDTETIEHTAAADTAYYVVVDSWRSEEFGCFTLEVSVE